LNKGAKIQAFDPEAMENFREEVTDEILYCSDQYDALKGADALAIITEWNVFRTPDFDKIKSLLNAPTIFDGRNLYDVKAMREKGFEYDSIGR
jgi:UDPglucose 6-dehydrogenase